ncbi:MAG: PASTA domain-containing protein, partial [Elusimicrobia bacterium]|nr:PASTA domain-containing protein [Elusimicrobiota bacterium]
MKKIFWFIIKFVVVLAILAVAGYYSFNIIMSGFVREKSEVLVPDLQGKNLVECLDMLSQSKLALMKDGSEFNQDVPAGIVIRQVPPAGMNVKEGKVIKIVISQGGEIVYVPDLKGQTIRSATISLRSLGLVLGELTKKSSAKYEEGIVLSQEPPAGSTIEKDSSVNVLVSNGAPTDGTVLMTISETDRQGSVFATVAQGFARLGFKILATDGTYKELCKLGVKAERVRRILRGLRQKNDRRGGIFFPDPDSKRQPVRLRRTNSQ